MGLDPWAGRRGAQVAEMFPQVSFIRLVKVACSSMLVQFSLGQKAVGDKVPSSKQTRNMVDICAGSSARRIAEPLIRALSPHPRPAVSFLRERFEEIYAVHVDELGDVIDALSVLVGDSDFVLTAVAEDVFRRKRLSNWLAAPGTEPFFQSPASVFACISDPWYDVVHSAKSLARTLDHGVVDTFVSVVGGLSSFNYLLFLEPKRIEFFDVNPHALRYGKMIVELIGISQTREEFISHLFSRSLTAFEQAGGKLSVRNQLSFLQVQPDELMRNLTQTALSEDAGRAFRDVLSEHQRVSFTDDGWRQGLTKVNPEKYYRYVIQLMLPVEEEESERILSPSGLGGLHNSCICYSCKSREETIRWAQNKPNCADWLRKWVNNCSFHYGEGWLRDAASFDRVRDMLLRVPPIFRNVDVLDPSGSFCAVEHSSPSSSGKEVVVASTMDIFGVWNQFIDRATSYRLQRHFANSCNTSVLLLLQSLVMKSDLCRLLVRGASGGLEYSHVSCSDWTHVDEPSTTPSIRTDFHDEDTDQDMESALYEPDDSVIMPELLPTEPFDM